MRRLWKFKNSTRPSAASAGLGIPAIDLVKSRSPGRRLLYQTMPYSDSVEQLEQRTFLAAGELDPSFGDAGVVTTPLAIAPVAVLPQADGKVLVAGETIATPGLNEPPYTQATYA